MWSIEVENVCLPSNVTTNKLSYNLNIMQSVEW